MRMLHIPLTQETKKTFFTRVWPKDIAVIILKAWHGAGISEKTWLAARRANRAASLKAEHEKREQLTAALRNHSKWWIICSVLSDDSVWRGPRHTAPIICGKIGKCDCLKDMVMEMDMIKEGYCPITELTTSLGAYVFENIGMRTFGTGPKFAPIGDSPTVFKICHKIEFGDVCIVPAL